MNANETTSETELHLDATLDETTSESDLTLEAELMPSEPMTRKQRKKYNGKIRLLGTIHAEIADAINARRKTEHEAWFVPYVPESKDKREYLHLHWLGMKLGEA